MNLLDLGNATVGPAASIKINIDDSEDGDGGHVGFAIPVANNQPVATSFKIDALGAGRLRWNIAGQHGTWRTSPGVYAENITASADGFARLEFDSFTVACIDYSTLAVG